MIRKVAISVCVFLIALPAFPHGLRAPNAQTHPGLHLMNDSEFAVFLKRLDTGVLLWKAQLSNVDVDSLGLDLQESKELGRSYNLCLKSLENTREEIQKLAQKQTLKLDFFLLIDLDNLARNLDGLDRDLANPVTVGGSSEAQKSVGYARQVLSIDAALSPHIAALQQHVLAFAGVIDDTLEQAGQDADQTQLQKQDRK